MPSAVFRTQFKTGVEVNTKTIDKFVGFSPKNDKTLYITRESRIPALKFFDENVFLKPMGERTEDEKIAPKALDENDIKFINSHSSMIHFKRLGDLETDFVADIGVVTSNMIQKINDELNKALMASKN